MKILNIKIRNFRNIVKVDSDFGAINIITGKNSSGKTNFLKALQYSLSTEENYSEIFRDNIVTYQKGKNNTVFNTVIGDMQAKYAFFRFKESIYVSPKKFRLEKTIEKRTSSIKSLKLFFTGNHKVLSENLKKTDPRDVFRDMDSDSEILDDRLVYEKMAAYIHGKDGDISLIKQSNKDELKYQDVFRDIFIDHSKSVKSWIDESNTSSSLIYNYITKIKPTAEEHDQIVEYLIKDEDEKRRGNLSFDESKFIYLLADIQKNEKVKENFMKDLSLYSQGILNNVFINLNGGIGNKGEIIVDSPQGPKDIFTISTGTAVLLFFITLKNWLSLDERAPFIGRYIKPSVMIFDELETNLHPGLLESLRELLGEISRSTQIFIATHSPQFLDYFDRNQIYYLKDSPSMSGNEEQKNRCNMYDYETIIRKLPKEDHELFFNKNNSELFVDGLIDLIFP